MSLRVITSKADSAGPDQPVTSSSKNLVHSEILVYYRIIGEDLDPLHVSEVTGLAPSKTWRLGDPVTPTPGTLRMKHHGWRVDSQLLPAADLEEQIAAVLERLRPAWPALQKLGGQFDAQIVCVVRSYGGDRPPISLGKGIVKRIADLSASIEVDLYMFDLDRP